MKDDSSQPTVRRVVTGEPQDRESAFTHVEEVEPLSPWPGFKQYYVWGWDGSPALPLNSAEPYAPRTHFPEPGGVRVIANVLGESGENVRRPRPDQQEDFDAFTALVGAFPAGRTTASSPGMHRTDTIDIGVVVSGEVTVESTDGSTVLLKPGDVYIQNGAMHAWNANPENPALVVFVLVGAERASDV
jgi:hypothetical protein